MKSEKGMTKKDSIESVSITSSQMEYYEMMSPSKIPNRIREKINFMKENKMNILEMQKMNSESPFKSKSRENLTLKRRLSINKLAMQFRETVKNMN